MNIFRYQDDSFEFTELVGENDDNADFIFMFAFFHRACCKTVVLISSYAKCVCVQAEQFRQRHPVWKPGGDPHLPAGTMCGFGGLYQVRHAGHRENPSIIAVSVEGHVLTTVYTILRSRCEMVKCVEPYLPQEFHKAYYNYSYIL